MVSARSWVIVSAAGVCLWTAVWAAGRLDHTPGPRGPSSPVPIQTIRIAGSTIMHPLVTEIARRFESRHPEIHVEVEAGGSGRGLEAVRAGACDIGMVSRAPQGDERELFSLPIARDGLCIIVHADNPVSTLSHEQIRAIYTGRARTWSEFGGRNASIVVISRTEGFSSLGLFVDYFGLQAQEHYRDRVVGPNAEALQAVADEPLGVAYASVGAAERAVQAGAPVRLLGLDGVPATTQNIRSGDFPLSRALTLVTRTLPSGAVRAFLEFADSAHVTDLVVGYEFVAYLD